MTPEIKTLLENAAKALGDKNIIKGIFPAFQRYLGENEELGCGVFVEWNPITNSGDSRDLQVKLKISLCSVDDIWNAYCFNKYDEIAASEEHTDPNIAVLLVASAIGAALKEEK